MRKKLLIATAVVAMTVGAAAHAGPFADCLSWCVPDCIQNYCCDDYRPKCPPCPKPVCCFECPDYCPKCPPCPKPVCDFECPDYCRKCPPCPCGPLPPGLTCGPERCFEP